MPPRGTPEFLDTYTYAQRTGLAGEQEVIFFSPQSDMFGYGLTVAHLALMSDRTFVNWPALGVQLDADDCPLHDDALSMFAKHAMHARSNPDYMYRRVHRALQPLLDMPNPHPVAVMLAEVALGCMRPLEHRFTAELAAQKLAPLKDTWQEVALWAAEGAVTSTLPQMQAQEQACSSGSGHGCGGARSKGAAPVVAPPAASAQQPAALPAACCNGTSGACTCVGYAPGGVDGVVASGGCSGGSRGESAFHHRRAIALS